MSIEEILNKVDILKSIERNTADHYKYIGDIEEAKEHEEDMKALEGILTLVDKLQKELKDSINARFELQRRIDKTQKENAELKRITYKAYINDNGEIQFIFDNYISKDKIKEALGDENIPDEMILTYIETLVSENNRLEDIEDRKVQIEYNTVFNKGVKSVEDKIRTKIKELEETTAEELRYDFLMNRDEVKNAFIRILEELLN